MLRLIFNGPSEQLERPILKVFPAKIVTAMLPVCGTLGSCLSMFYLLKLTKGNLQPFAGMF
jgi:hypothetical protein